MSAPLSDEDKGFIRAILDHPEELTTWLAYADWLDERDDPRAEFLRLTAERRITESTQRAAEIDVRLKVLWIELDLDWLGVFDTSRLRNCRKGGWPSVCPWNTWDKLAPTDDPVIRICHLCKSPAFYCTTIGEARDYVTCNQVVALWSRFPEDKIPDEPAFRDPPDHFEDFDDIRDADTLGE